jgi:hypothetical protein|tara:strand:+ start:1616 stop:2278 length:663 start_codon:yes stop_codon:yes gene_type:complete
MKYLKNKMKLSTKVRKALGRYPYIEEYLDMGIINNRALARTIQDYLDEEVNIQSIVSAIRRFPVYGVKSGQEKLLTILANSEVNLRFDSATVTLNINEHSLEEIDALHTYLEGKRYMLLQGMQTLTIVTEERESKKLGEKLGITGADFKKKLATVIVTSPIEIVTTSGVIAHLATLLAMDGINVVEMMSSQTETSFIVDEREALKAVEVIRKEIKRARKN